MSITTKRGDQGQTDLLYGRRVAKSDLRIAAYGTVDELTSALGMARAQAASESRAEPVEIIRTIQNELIGLMGELATDPADLDRYHRDGHPAITTAEVERLTALGRDLETRTPKFTGWIIPGAAGDRTAAAIDFARAVARRAERDAVDLAECEEGFNAEILRYLNRLSDVLWLLARVLESP